MLPFLVVSLCFLHVAINEQRVQGVATILSICRLAAVISSSAITGVAHMH